MITGINKHKFTFLKIYEALVKLNYLVTCPSFLQLQFWILVTEVKVGLWYTLLSLKYSLLPPTEQSKYWYDFVNRWLILETLYLRFFRVSWNHLSQKCFKGGRSRGLSQPKFEPTSRCCTRSCLSLSVSVKINPRHVELIKCFTQIRP